MKILDGKAISTKIKAEIKAEVQLLKNKDITVTLAVVLVGNDPASEVYVRNKELDCEQTGINSVKYVLEEKTSENELLELLDKLNNDKNISGILVQSPLPSHIDEKKIFEHINPKKDVDAFNSYNVGKIMIGNYDFLPCTPAGVMEMLKYSNIEVAGKNCVVLGRSNIVGKPMAMLLLHANGTVTICHSKTKNLSVITKEADILIAAIRQPNFVNGDMVKDGVIVIDVGINRTTDNKLTGDIDFESVSKKASYITPVPGGVGPMTRVILLKNTLKAAKIANSIE